MSRKELYVNEQEKEDIEKSLQNNADDVDRIPFVYFSGHDAFVVNNAVWTMQQEETKKVHGKYGTVYSLILSAIIILIVAITQSSNMLVELVLYALIAALCIALYFAFTMHQFDSRNIPLWKADNVLRVSTVHSTSRNLLLDIPPEHASYLPCMADMNEYFNCSTGKHEFSSGSHTGDNSIDVFSVFIQLSTAAISPDNMYDTFLVMDALEELSTMGQISFHTEKEKELYFEKMNIVKSGIIEKYLDFMKLHKEKQNFIAQQDSIVPVAQLELDKENWSRRFSAE